jgi:hypothetical protein
MTNTTDRFMPDWSKIPEPYNISAVDESGEQYAYTEDPTIHEDVWLTKDDLMSQFRFINDLGEICPDWKNSKRHRPASSTANAVPDNQLSAVERAGMRLLLGEHANPDFQEIANGLRAAENIAFALPNTEARQLLRALDIILRATVNLASDPNDMIVFLASAE